MIIVILFHVLKHFYIFAVLQMLHLYSLNLKYTAMKNIGYIDYWHNHTTECADNCNDEISFTDKVKSCAVCVGNFVSTAYKAIFKL